MKNQLNIFIASLFVSLLIPTSQYLVFGQSSNSSSPFDITNQSRSKSDLTKNETSLSDLEGKYTSTDINEKIYNLYDDYLRSNKKTDQDHFHDIAVLIDFICSNKTYEDAIEACDIVTEFPID
ncbi:MAG TPA: hypothetical protein VJM74_02770 [Nitrososphaeraceae archaeon]|nr:hypothetical protein [Nitrososphaeraceae archaeon]